MGLLGAVPLALVAVANVYSFFAGRGLSLAALAFGIGMFAYLYFIPRSVSVGVTTERLNYRGFDGLRWRRGSIEANSVIDFNALHPYSASLPPAGVEVVGEGATAPYKIPLGSLDPRDRDLVLKWLSAAQQSRKRRLGAGVTTDDRKER